MITDSAAAQPPDDLGLASRNSNQELPVSVDAYPCFRVVGSTQHAVSKCNCGTDVTFRTYEAGPTSPASLIAGRSLRREAGLWVPGQASELIRRDDPPYVSRALVPTAHARVNHGSITVSGVA